MNKFDNEIINLTKNCLVPPSDFDIKIDNTLKTMYRREIKQKSKFIKVYEKVLKFFITLVSLLSVTSLAGYTGYIIYDNYNQANVVVYETQYGNFNTQLYEDSFIVSDTDTDFLEYIVLDNIDKYLTYKELIENIPLMEESDFKEKVLLMLVWRYTPKDGLKIENIEVENEKTIVTLSDRDMTGHRLKHSIIMTVVPRELIKDEIVFDIIPGTEYISNYNFTIMSDVDKEYIYNQGIKEGCIITDWNNKLIYNENKLYEFLNKVEQGENCAIRNIRVFNQENITWLDEVGDNCEFAIIDTIYENGRFYQYASVYTVKGKYKCSSLKKDGIKIVTEEDVYDKWWYIEYEDGTKFHMVHLIEKYEKK